MIIELPNGCARIIPLDDDTCGIEILTAATDTLGPQQVLLAGEQALLDLARLCITAARETTASSANDDEEDTLNDL